MTGTRATVLVSSAESAILGRIVDTLGGQLVATGGPVELPLELGLVPTAGGDTLTLLGCRRDARPDLLHHVLGHGVVGHLLLAGPGPLRPVPIEVLSTVPTVVGLLGRATDKSVRRTLRDSGAPARRCDSDDRDSMRAVLGTLLDLALGLQKRTRSADWVEVNLVTPHRAAQAGDPR